MRRLALLLLCLALPASASAGTVNCNSTMVSGGLCRSTGNKLVGYDMPAAVASDLADALASLKGYASPTTCTSQLVTAGVCTSGQIGSMVPITKAQFADFMLRRILISIIREYKDQQAADAARATTQAAADPDVGQ